MLDNELHNVRSNLLGTGNFLFAQGAKTLAQAEAAGWTDYGSIQAHTLTAENTRVDVPTAYKGVRRIKRRIPTMTHLGYLLRTRESNHRNLRHAYYAEDAAPWTQPALTADNGDVLAFTMQAPAVPNIWYAVKKDGAGVRGITELTISSLTEGSDFVVDKERGLVRFTTAQSSSLTPVITAPAIDSNSPLYLRGLTPMKVPVRRGFGRLTVYDQDEDAIVAYDHLGFSCEISINNSPEVADGQLQEFELMVTVTETPGTLYNRD